LPISLAGWGVREAVLVVALASFGVPSEAALAMSVLLGLCLIASGLPGGLIWLGNWDIGPSGMEKELCEASMEIEGFPAEMQKYRHSMSMDRSASRILLGSDLQIGLG